MNLLWFNFYDLKIIYKYSWFDFKVHCKTIITLLLFSTFALSTVLCQMNKEKKEINGHLISVTIFLTKMDTAASNSSCNSNLVCNANGWLTCVGASCSIVLAQFLNASDTFNKENELSSELFSGFYSQIF